MRNAETIPVHLDLLNNAAPVNAELDAGFRRLVDDTDIPRSHWFDGRYENIYVPQDRLPALSRVLEAAISRASRITGRSAEALRCRYWFNAMEPGQHTGLHSHDEGGEILCAAYYVRAPHHSGDLVLRHNGEIRRIAPREGMFVFFAPEVPHEVEINCSSDTRLSIGMNFGLEGRPGD